MTDTEGVVTGLDGQFAMVRIDQSGCGRCHEDGGCGGHNLGRFLCRTPEIYRVLNGGNAAIGDRVTVTVPEGVVKRGALFAYVLPLVALFAGAFAGKTVGGDIGSVVGAVGGLMVAFLAARFFRRSSGSGENSLPYIRR